MNAQSREQPNAMERCTSAKTVESGTKFVSRLSVGNANLQGQRVQGPWVKKHKDWSPPCTTAAPGCGGGRTVGLSPPDSRKASPRQPVGQPQGSAGAALPNPSLKLSPNGGPPGPGRRYAVHCLQPGPGVPPLVPT